MNRGISTGRETPSGTECHRGGFVQFQSRCLFDAGWLREPVDAGHFAQIRPRAGDLGRVRLSQLGCRSSGRPAGRTVGHPRKADQHRGFRFRVGDLRGGRRADVCPLVLSHCRPGIADHAARRRPPGAIGLFL